MPIDLYCGCGATLIDYRERITGWCLDCLARQTRPQRELPVAVQDEPEDEETTDPVTRRLIDDALKTHGKDHCPECWHPGRFIRMALVCPRHGAFAGT